MEKDNRKKLFEENFNKEKYLIRLSDINNSLMIYADDDFSTNELLLRKKELEIILNYFDNNTYNKHKCKVCGKEFLLKKENKYFVNSKNYLFNVISICEAFDCEYCGCQNIVNCCAPKSKKYSNISIIGEKNE